MTNPYAEAGRIRTGTAFVGRAAEVRRVRAAIEHGAANVSVYGPNRIGKTSIVHEAVRQAAFSGSRRPLVMVSAESVESAAQLMLVILRDFARRLPPGTALPEDLARIATRVPFHDLTEVQSILEGWSERGFRGVAVIDEFDRLRQFPDGQRLIGPLRGMISDDRYGLRTVLIGRRTLRSIEAAFDASTLAGVCDLIPIHPFTELEHAALCAKAEAVVRDLRLERLWAITGGHPFITEVVLREAWERGSMEDGILASQTRLVDEYERLRGILEFECLFDDLLQVAVGPRWSVAVNSENRLKDYGIVRARPDGLRGWSDHFQLYLERVARSAELWPLWRDTERALRRLIEEKYRAALGADWLDALGRERPALTKLRAGWEATRAKDMRAFGPIASCDLLDYAYPLELWTLIEWRWGLFEPLLGSSPERWRSKFEHLARIRNSEAHNRTIPDDNITQAKGICEELLRQMRR